MCEKISFVASLVALIHVASGGLAPFIVRCEAADSKCIKKSTENAIPIIAKGIPEFGMEPLDPLHYNTLDASSKDLKLILTDITIVGLKNCVVKDIKRDKANSKITLNVVCNVVLDGNYNISGNLFVLPIQGDGKLHAKLNQISIKIEVITGVTVKNGKEHWIVKSWSHTYKLKAKAELHLDNLFDGNKVLGQAVESLLNNGANEVIGEVGSPIVHAFIAKVVKTLKHFCSNVPAEELAID